MAVQYDVIYSDNRRILAQGGCFGAMNAGRWAHWMVDYSRYGDRSGLTVTENNRMAQESFQQVIQDQGNQRIRPVAIQFYPKPSSGIWGVSAPHGSTLSAFEAYFAAMADLLPQVAWLDGVVSLHPEFGVIRFHLDDKPADQVITAMFLFRNLAHYNYGHSFQNLINVHNMNVLPALYLAHLMIYQPRTPFSAESWYMATPGEYNLQHPLAFGKRALAAVLTADESFSPWRQRTFSHQNGYMRDNMMGGDVPFDADAPLDRRRRTLSTVLCLPGDEIIFPNSQDAAGRAYTGHGNASITIPNTLFDVYLDSYASVCREAGVEPFYR